MDQRPAPDRAAGLGEAEINRRRIVWLLWAYFALLIFEGALRKWVLPELSDALFVSRDPIAAAILFFGVRDGFMPSTPLTRAFAWLAAAFVALAGVQFAISDSTTLFVTMFGLRTYVLHPPVVFVMAAVLSSADLRRFGEAVLWLMLPIALLMVLQFRATPADWINRGAGAGLQIFSALGHVRPAGPFSFITGPILFYSLALACLLGASFGRGRRLFVLRIVGWGALVIAASVSGSRAFLVGLAQVLAAAAALLVLRPRLSGRLIRALAVASIVGVMIWSIDAVQDGLEVFRTRLDITANEDTVARSLTPYLLAEWAWTEAPLAGVGLGLGTNAGSVLLREGLFRLGEGEWSRVIFEAGPVFGLAYVLWRVWFAVGLTRAAMKSAADGYAFPLLCAGAVVVDFVNGTWGQATTQGFAVWVAGIAAAACRVVQERRVVTVERRAA